MSQRVAQFHRFPKESRDEVPSRATIKRDTDVSWQVRLSYPYAVVSASRLEAAATAESPDDLDEHFWGPAPDSVTAVKAVFADLSDQFAQRRQLAANGISRDDAAELLGITAQSVTAKLASRKLVGIKVGREWRLPTWQFDPDVPTGVLPDLDALQAAFPGGPVSLSRWVLTTQPEFDGRSAREEMILHGTTPVVELARVLTATGW